MAHYLDLNSWNRSDHYEFFRQYEQPFFGVCSSVDVSETLTYTREQHISFFLFCLYLATRAANEIEPFRFRLRHDGVLVHDQIHIGSAILYDDHETFGYCYWDFHSDFNQFYANADPLFQAARQGEHSLDPVEDRDDLIHFSTLPWIHFSSFSHARKRLPLDSIPKIVFGQHQTRKWVTTMPVSVEVHHALMDGLHVGRFMERFQAMLDEPEKSLKG